MDLSVDYPVPVVSGRTGRFTSVTRDADPVGGHRTVECCSVGYCSVGYCTVGYCTVGYCIVIREGRSRANLLIPKIVLQTEWNLMKAQFELGCRLIGLVVVLYVIHIVGIFLVAYIGTREVRKLQESAGVVVTSGGFSFIGALFVAGFGTLGVALMRSPQFVVNFAFGSRPKTQPGSR